MRIALPVVAVAACTPPSGPVAPQVAAQLRLISCEPALPLPRTPGDVEIGVVPSADAATEDSPFRNVPRPLPSVAGGVPTVAGSLDRSIVVRVVKAHMAQLRDCYERELAVSPGTTGKVTVTFTVAPDGKIASTRAISTDVSPALSACVVRVVQHFQFPTGATFTVTYPFTFSNTGDVNLGPKEAVPVLRARSAWTPFAIDDAQQPIETARKVARATEGAVRGKLADLAACFDAGAPSGSLRVMLGVGGEGTVGAARAGGLGDARREACVAKQLLDLHVMSPVHDAAEVACDFSRGDARPWRVAADAGYSVIEIRGRELRHGSDVLTPKPVEPAALPGDQTFLVIAEPATSGELIELAIAWARRGDATLLAVRSDREPPVLVGAARTEHQVGGMEAAQAWPRLRLAHAKLIACIDESRRAKPNVRDAALDDATAVDDLVRRIAARCQSVRCGSSLGVAIDPDARMGDLLEVAAAARRAGFDRVLLGSGGIGCTRTQRGP